MKTTNRIRGLFLLLGFGLLCGVGTGMGVGLCAALYFIIAGAMTAKGIITMLWYGVGVGALTGFIPGALYGLASYYITKTWQWSVDGGFWAGVGYLLIVQLTNTQFFGQALLFCVLCGFLAGAVNGVYSNWWGRRLHADAITLLRQTN